MSSSKEVLFITYDGLTDPLGQSQVMPYTIGLSQNGYKVTILSNEKRENYRLYRSLIDKKLKSANISWEHCKYNDIPFIGNLINIRSLRRKAAYLNRKKKFKILHCRSVIPAIIGEKIRDKKMTKLIFDMRGFWADEKVDGRLWNLSNPVFRIIYSYFKSSEIKMLEKADYIVTLTENAKKYILDNYNNKGKLQVIPCAANLKHFSYENLTFSKTESLRSELNLKAENFVLSYIGSLGTRYRLNDMLRFFLHLKKEINGAKFLFITKTDKSIIFEACRKLNIDESDIVITSSSYNEVPYYIGLSDLSIFFIVTSFSGKAVSPTKQAEVLGLGVPIVTNSGLGDTDTIIKSANCGLIVDSYDDDALAFVAKKVVKLKLEKEEVRRTALKYFSLNEAVKKYTKVYEELEKELRVHV